MYKKETVEVLKGLLDSFRTYSATICDQVTGADYYDSSGIDPDSFLTGYLEGISDCVFAVESLLKENNEKIIHEIMESIGK
jgi:hypothetical protein